VPAGAGDELAAELVGPVSLAVVQLPQGQPLDLAGPPGDRSNAAGQRVVQTARQVVVSRSRHPCRVGCVHVSASWSEAGGIAPPKLSV
jgi:hypothetical protein